MNEAKLIQETPGVCKDYIFSSLQYMDPYCSWTLRDSTTY